MADLEERIRTFLKTIPAEDEADSAGDTFAERAEWFFKKRPELLSLLKELYNGYVSMKETKHQRRNSSSLALSVGNQPQQQQEEQEIDTNWDIESSLSNQTPDFDYGVENGKAVFRTGSWVMNTASFSSARTGVDDFVGNFVVKSVEEEILRGQMGEMEVQLQECGRKMEILGKLIHVLESERVILLSENSRLGFRVGELMEENRGLVTEVICLKRRAAQLGRCVVKMREDQRVDVLTRRIEDLQAQIDGLEEKKERGLRSFSMGGCFQGERLMRSKRRSEEDEGKRGGRKWWEKIKKGISLSGFGLSPLHSYA